MNKSINHKDGYIALSVVLVILAIITLIGLTVSFGSIGELQTSFGSKQSESSLNIVEACVEEALLQINEDNQVEGVIVLPEGSCLVTVISQTGMDWEFLVESINNSYKRKVRVKARREMGVKVLSWLEE